LRDAKLGEDHRRHGERADLDLRRRIHGPSQPVSSHWKAGVANTGATTLNVDGIGAVSVKTIDGLALTGGEVRLNHYYRSLYDGTDHILLNPEPANINLVSGVVTTVAVLDLALTGTYDVYELFLSRFEVAVAAAYPILRISTDSGANYKFGASDYRWGFSAFSDGGLSSTDNSAGSTFIQLANRTAGLQNSVANYLAHIRICNPTANGAGYVKRIMYDFAHTVASDADDPHSGSGAYVD
jgi:hypothetical protein